MSFLNKVLTAANVVVWVVVALTVVWWGVFVACGMALLLAAALKGEQ